ncbi:MAG: LysR family transcriptional regulator [Pseudomonadota bacterium]
MADEYKALAVFAAVADSGSFSAAAKRLKLSTSVVSHHVSKLEERLGVSLLYRSTRSLSLTAEGEKVLPAARQMVLSADLAMDALADELDQLVGALRITMPTFGVHTELHQAVWAFAREHPMVALTLHSTDRQVDLIRDGFDMGIRLGNLADSSLMTRRIGTFSRVLVAAPEYLKQNGEPNDPETLKSCAFVALAMLPTAIVLQRAEEQITLEPDDIRLEVDTVSAAKAAILAGLGIQRLPLSEVQEELEIGQLVEVLPGWRPPDLGVYAVWPDAGSQRKLTRRLVEYLASVNAS